MPTASRRAASDADGDSLSFSILNRPAWASFSSSTGRLSGTPAESDVGNYGNIVISVSDGEDSAALPAFSVTVDTGITAPATVFHQSEAGLLVMEAESFDINVGGNGVAPWQVVDGQDAGGGRALKAPPGTFTAAPDTSRADYSAELEVGGTLYAWVRARAFDGGSNSVFLEMDATGPIEQQFDNSYWSGEWFWHRVGTGIGVAPGLHTIKLYRRESSTEVDRILLTTNPDLTPVGTELPESPRAAPGVAVPPPPNLAPVISGTPAALTTAGQPYLFVPSAYDPEGLPISFGIQGRPAWASFNSANGRLEGTPGDNELGVYTNIRISVTDGESVVELPAFSIEVVAGATAGFTISWTPPLTNLDGSALSDLAGYRIYLGTQSGQYSQVVEINNPGITSYTFDQLPTGTTYYLAITAFNASGNESPPSEEVTAQL